MPDIIGLHHLSLLAVDAVRSGEWYERVLGFNRILVEEDEDGVTAVAVEHPCGIVLFVHQCSQRLPLPRESAVFALSVRDLEGLTEWTRYLAALGVAHSPPRLAHLGWALDVTGPDGVRFQLHTHETLSSDDA